MRRRTRRRRPGQQMSNDTTTLLPTRTVSTTFDIVGGNDILLSEIALGKCWS